MSRKRKQRKQPEPVGNVLAAANGSIIAGQPASGNVARGRGFNWELYFQEIADDWWRDEMRKLGLPAEIIEQHEHFIKEINGGNLASMLPYSDFLEEQGLEMLAEAARDWPEHHLVEIMHRNSPPGQWLAGAVVRFLQFYDQGRE